MAITDTHPGEIRPSGGTRNRSLWITSLILILLLLALPGGGSGAENNKNYILLGASQDNSPDTWTLSFTPPSAINVLPGNISHEFILSIRHKTSQNPVKSKTIDFATDFGVFQNGAQNYTAVTDENGNISIIVSSSGTGTATITARTQPPVQIATATKSWIGISPYPAITLFAEYPMLLMEGEDASLTFYLVNDGNVPLTDPRVTINGVNATFASGDNGNGVLDSTESWRYGFTAPVTWTPDSPVTFRVNASARFDTLVLGDSDQITYHPLLITKAISNPRVREVYSGTPFNVTARQGGDTAVYGPFPISVQDPAEIWVGPGNWTFTEENRTIDGETLEPFVAMISYREGDTPSLGFENRLTQYLPMVTQVALSEHEATNNLTAGETSHTFRARVTDQYDQPVAGMNLTFEGVGSITGRQGTVLPTNETGWAEWTVSSDIPQTMAIYAFLDANRDTCFNLTEGEIGDSGTKTWYYLPVPATLQIQGAARVTNDLDLGEFNHTFQILLTDQYGYPVPGILLSYEIDYQFQDSRDRIATALTDSEGVLNITVVSSVPDMANITVSLEQENVTLRKTWQYTPIPQYLEIRGDRHAVNDLDQEEFGHTFVVTVLDQFLHPIPMVPVNFTVDYDNLSRESSGSDVFTDEQGNATLFVESHHPDLATITARVGGVEEVLTKTWTYTPSPARIRVEGAADAMNNLTREEFEHTFNVTVLDQFGAGIPDQPVFHTVGYEIQTDLNRSGILTTDSFGQIAIRVISEQPDGATIRISAGDQNITLRKTWYTMRPPLTTLLLRKDAEDRNGGALVVGDTIRYTLTLENTGAYPAYQVRVTDPLSGFVTCQNVSGDRSGSCIDPIDWEVGTLQPGDVLHLIIDVILNEDAVGQSVLNSANATGDNVNETPSDPEEVCPDGAYPIEGRCPNTPVHPAILLFTKDAVDENGAPLLEGDRIRYTLTIRNNATYPAYNVIISDTLPAGLTCQDMNGDPDACAPMITRALGTLAPGAEESITIHATINPGTAGWSIINTGTVTSNNTPPVDPPQVCPDGSLPIEGICPNRPEPPVTPTPTPPREPEPPYGGNIFHLARNAVEEAYTETSTGCGDGEIYVEGKGCIRCEPDEVYIEGQGCVRQNITSMMGAELPRTPLTLITGMLTNLLMNPLMILALLLLAALFLVVWWRRRETDGGSQPLPGGAGIIPPTPSEAAYASIIGVLNEIDAQLTGLEQIVTRRVGLSPMEANAAAEKFFFTTQVAEEHMKNPDIRQHLSTEQIDQLNLQLQAAVQKMIALSRQSETLLDAVQTRYGTAAAGM